MEKDSENSNSHNLVNLKVSVNSLKKKQEIQNENFNYILNNIDEIIINVGPEGLILKNSNPKLSKDIFGEDIHLKSIFEIFFYKYQDGKSSLKELETSLNSINEIDLNTWNNLKINLPKKVNFSKNKKEKNISIKYNELFDQKELKIKEIIFIIKDITGIEKLIENKKRVIKRNIIISELVPEKGRNLEKHKNALNSFFQESRTLIREASKLASAKDSDTINKWDEKFIWKNVHTVKSNSRFFGLKGISSKLHEEEIKFSFLKSEKKKITDEIIFEICDSLLAIIEIISDYQSTAEEIFGLNTIDTELKETKFIEIEKLKNMDDKIKSLSKKIDLEEMEEVKDEWGNLFKSSLLDLLKGFDSLVNITSKELGKNISFKVGGDDIHLKENILTKISDSIIHLLRNSIDHGIELPKTRKKVGKSQKGFIEIKCLMLDSSFQLSIKDDGKGIDGHLLGEKAIKENIISRDQFESMMDNERINLIFAEGFSSKVEANTVSGRGLGMDIIHQNIKSLGGQIKIITKEGNGTEFVLTFPLNSNQFY